MIIIHSDLPKMDYNAFAQIKRRKLFYLHYITLKIILKRT